MKKKSKPHYKTQAEIDEKLAAADAKKKTRNRTAQFTKEQIIKAIQGSGGIKTVIGKNLGVSHTSVTRYINRFPEVELAYLEEKERMCDLVEAQIIKKCQAGDNTMLIFFAKCQMRHRGWIEKAEIDHTIKGNTGVLFVPGSVSESEWQKLAEQQQKTQLKIVAPNAGKHP